MDRFFVVGSRDMTGRIFSLFPVANFSPVTLSGHRNTVRGCFFEENSLDVSLLVFNSGCKLINSMWWVYSLGVIQGFIEGWAQDKLTHCEDSLAQLV